MQSIMEWIMYPVTGNSKIPGVMSKWQYFIQQSLVALLVLYRRWTSTSSQRKSRLSNCLPFFSPPTSLQKSPTQDPADVSVCGMTLQMHQGKFMSSWVPLFPFCPPPWQLTVLGRKRSFLMVGKKQETNHEFASFWGVTVASHIVVH